MKTREIPLTQGKVALVGQRDYKRMSQHKWFARWDGYNWYAARNIILSNGTRRTLSMHVDLMGKMPGHEIDHRDGNGLNNQRNNLRFLAHAKNMLNRGIQANNTSGSVGVSFHQYAGKYRAYGKLNGKHIHLGLYDTLAGARGAYKRFAAKHYKIT